MRTALELGLEVIPGGGEYSIESGHDDGHSSVPVEVGVGAEFDVVEPLPPDEQPLTSRRAAAAATASAPPGTGLSVIFMRVHPRVR
jgi:hypothetical protein